MRLEVFELKHRSAETVEPALRPLLDARGRMSADGFRLIVRSTPQNLKELEDLLADLDAPRTTLLIELRRSHEQASRRDHAALEGEMDSERGAQARGRIHTTRRDAAEGGVQRLRVMEGSWAAIRAGEEIPVARRSTLYGPGGVTVEEGVAYREATTGFEVRPRLHDDEVQLDIRPHRTRPAARGGGVLETDQLITTIRGPLDSWLELGGWHTERAQEGSGTIYRTRDREQERGTLQIRIRKTP